MAVLHVHGENFYSNSVTVYNTRITEYKQDVPYARNQTVASDAFYADKSGSYLCGLVICVLFKFLIQIKEME